MRAPQEKKLPVVLSHGRCNRSSAVCTPLYRVCLTTLYACGLRLNEGRCLQVPNIDSHTHAPARPRQGQQGPLCAPA